MLTHLECSACGTMHDAGKPQGVCTACGKALLARYDLEKIRTGMQKASLKGREQSMWRYRELLPVQSSSNIISLGEGGTPILLLSKEARRLGISDLRFKDEGLNPTGSFKARGLCMAVSRARELGITEVCIPSAGNAGGALAAYAAAAGMTCHVFMPDDTPRANIQECYVYGADVRLVPGVISDAAKKMNEERSGRNWFDVSTLKEPYRLEGKKTLGFEIAEHYGWNLPDVIVYPTGGGTGLIGMWKAFEEMEQLGWIDHRRPRMVAVQSSGCAPIVKAFDSGAPSATFWPDASTVASGLRVPGAFADTLILRVLRESHGCAVAVDDASIVSTVRTVATSEGVLLCPEGAATVAALPELIERGVITHGCSVLVMNTGSGLKYAEVLEQCLDNSA